MITAKLMDLLDGSTTKVSPGYQKGDLMAFSVQFLFSSNTMAGTVSLECSNTDVGAYIPIPASSTAVVAGAGGMINVNNGAYRWIRARWVPTAGAGLITADLVVIQPANRN